MVTDTEEKATSRQLWKLHTLTNKDTRAWDLSKEKASDMIDSIVGGKVVRNIVVPPKPTSVIPFTEAKVAIASGDQGHGKSTFAVARIRDAYDKDCARVYCEEVLHITCEVKSFDLRARTGKIKHNGKLKLLHIPKDYKLHSPIKIFSNIHLHHMSYVFCPSFEHIMAWLKRNLMVDGWLLVDEAYLGMNARSCMTQLGKELESQYFQLRKMRLNVIIVTPMARLIDWTLRTIPTERVECQAYNPKTRKITVTIRKKGVRGEHTFNFDASRYWKYFDTNERVTQ